MYKIQKHGQLFSLLYNFIDTFSDSDYVALKKGVISERWIGKDVNGRGRGIIIRYYPSIWTDWGKSQKTSVMIADLWANILTWYLPNTKQGVLTTQPQRSVETVRRVYHVILELQRQEAIVI
jgi:hypothetical protein